ncbi:MAG: glycosyltransferase [Muribaculaceae bacterium]
MRILQVVTSLQTGGVEKLVSQISPMLRSLGHDVEVALFDGCATPFLSAVEAQGIVVHRFSLSGRSVYSPKNLWQLWRLLRRGHYDVVHTHNTAPQLFAALCSILCHTTYCTTEHSTSNRRRGSRFYALVDRWMYSRYSRVICISQKAEDNLRAFIGDKSSRIITINNGIDPTSITSASPLPDFKPEGIKAVTMVAAFRWEKDQDTLIRALASLPERFHLYLVGDGARRPDCEHLAETLAIASRVHFLGLRTDVPRILRSSDYVVMSSHFEGLSLSSVEGMAAARPMIASDVDGLREVVGGSGILFPHGDDKALADAITRLDNAQAYYDEVADRCSRRAQTYDIHTMVDSYNSTYSTITSIH